MSETEGQEEPSMEEILASIRKIISEDDVEEEKAAEPEAVSEPEPEPEPAEEEQVLELTEVVEEDIVKEPEDEPEPEPEPVEEPEAVMELEAEPEPEIEPQPEMETDLAIDDVDPASGDDVLMSGESSAFTMDQFGVLSDLLTTGYKGSGNTLEDLVREMLKPMLKTWLDQNLPPIVERMVAKEIARLARTKKP